MKKKTNVCSPAPIFSQNPTIAKGIGEESAKKDAKEKKIIVLEMLKVKDTENQDIVQWTDVKMIKESA